jgi:electron transfer flavoprotein beta subunit
VEGSTEVYRLPLPACLSVKEGINLPRYPSVPGRLRAKQKEIRRLRPAYRPGGPELIRLRLPEEAEHKLEILGHGPEAAPAVVTLLRQLGLLRE